MTLLIVCWTPMELSANSFWSLVDVTGLDLDACQAEFGGAGLPEGPFVASRLDSASAVSSSQEGWKTIPMAEARIRLAAMVKEEEDRQTRLAEYVRRAKERGHGRRDE